MTNTVDVAVRAEREGRWWVLHIDGGGTTQAKTLSQIESMVADYVSLTRGVPTREVRVTIADIDPGEGIAAAIMAARQAQAESVRAQETAAAKVRALVKTLRERGLSGAEIAIILGVSKQRVSQLAATANTAAPANSASEVRVSGSSRSAITPRSA